MRFVEEKYELWLFGIAHFGQLFEQFRQEPKQEGGVETRRAHELLGGEHVDDAAAVAIGFQKIRDLQRRLAEEFVCALVFKHEQAALDRADRRRRDVPVLRRERGGIVGCILQHSAQILEVEDQQALLVGNAEDDVEHAFLRVVELEQLRDEKGSHLGDGRAHGMALFAKNVPEHDGEAIRRISDANILRAFRKCGLCIARHADAGEIAFHIRRKDRRASVGKTFRQELEGDSLAGPGRTSHEAMAIAEAERQICVRFIALADEDFARRVCRVGGL
jgi:hypothetical protein